MNMLLSATLSLLFGGFSYPKISLALKEVPLETFSHTSTSFL